MSHERKKRCSKVVPAPLNPGVRLVLDYEASNLPALAVAPAPGVPAPSAPYIRYHVLEAGGTSPWPAPPVGAASSTRNAAQEQTLVQQRCTDLSATDYDMDEDDEDWLKKFDAKAAKRSKPGQARVRLDEERFELLVQQLEMLHFTNLKGRSQAWMKDIKLYKVPHIPAVEVVLSRSAAVKALAGEADNWTLEQVYDHWKTRFKANKGPLLPHLWFEQPWKARNFRDPEDPNKIGDMPFNEPEQSRYKPRKRGSHQDALEQLVGQREELEVRGRQQHQQQHQDGQAADGGMEHDAEPHDDDEEEHDPATAAAPHAAGRMQGRRAAITGIIKNVRLMTDQVKRREKLKRTQVKLWSDQVQLAIESKDPELLPAAHKQAAASSAPVPGRTPTGRFTKHSHTAKTDDEEAGQQWQQHRRNGKRAAEGRGGSEEPVDQAGQLQRSAMRSIKSVPAAHIPQTQQQGGVRGVPAGLPARCSTGPVAGARVGAGSRGTGQNGKQQPQQTRASMLIKAATERRGRKRAAAATPPSPTLDIEVVELVDERPTKRQNTRSRPAEDAAVLASTPAVGSHLLGPQKHKKQGKSGVGPGAAKQQQQHAVMVRFTLPQPDYVYPDDDEDEDAFEEYDPDDTDDADYVPASHTAKTSKSKPAATPSTHHTPASGRPSRHALLSQSRTPVPQQAVRSRPAPATEPPAATARQKGTRASSSTPVAVAVAPPVGRMQSKVHLVAGVSSRKRPAPGADVDPVTPAAEEPTTQERPAKRPARGASEPAPALNSGPLKPGVKAAAGTAKKAAAAAGSAGSRLLASSSTGKARVAAGSKIALGANAAHSMAAVPPPQPSSRARATAQPVGRRTPSRSGSAAGQEGSQLSAADLSRALRVAPNGAQVLKASATRLAPAKSLSTGKPASNHHSGSRPGGSSSRPLAHPVLASVKQAGSPSPARVSHRPVASPLAAELMIAQAVLQNPKRSRELASLQMSSSTSELVPQELRKFLGPTLADRTNL